MRVYEDISLKGYNTFGIDVLARRLMVLEPDDTIPQIEGDLLVLGAGSDMLFTQDYNGTVVILSDTPFIVRQPSNIITVWGGMAMDDLVQWCIDHDLYGLENLSAIPGTVGASAVQNVGAYGAEAKDFIEQVEAYDLQAHQYCFFGNADCRFAYRHSVFKENSGRYLILRVTFCLQEKYIPNLSYKALEGLPHDTAQRLRDAITYLRWSKLPRPAEYGSAGSFFKNPVVDDNIYNYLKGKYPDMPDAHQTTDGFKLSAGWLIDRAGWKGKSIGRAGVWPKNALVLYNMGDCTGKDVILLAHAIQADVEDKFCVTLEPEAIFI